MNSSTNFLVTGHQIKAFGMIMLNKIKVVLRGKDFQPMPSYWALIPIRQDNKPSSKQF
ncbi:MAG: hypothetical protein ABIO04_05895 [Ferruginibacter sp.]